MKGLGQTWDPVLLLHEDLGAEGRGEGMLATRSPDSGPGLWPLLTWKMAWEREDVALASVGCCVRLRFPRVSMPSSCSAEVGCRRDMKGGGCGLSNQDFSQQKGRSSEPMSPPCYHHCHPDRIQDIPKLPGEGIPEDQWGCPYHLSPSLTWWKESPCTTTPLSGSSRMARGPLGSRRSWICSLYT